MIALGAHSSAVASWGSSLTTGAVTTQASGSTLVAMLAGSSSFGAGTIVDSKGNTWVQTIVDIAFHGTFHHLNVWTCQNAVGGAGHTVTFSPAAGQSMVGELIEVTGVDPGSLDQSAVATANSVTTITTAPIADLNANDLVLAFGASAGSNVVTGVAAPFTFIDALNDGSNNVGTGSAYQIVSSTGTYQATFTNSGNPDCAGATLSFKQLGGSGASGTAATAQAETATLSGSSAAGAIPLALGGHASAVATFTSTATTGAATTMATGSTLVAACVTDNPFGTGTVTDSMGNTWTQVIADWQFHGTFRYLNVFACQNAIGGAGHTVTFNLQTGATFVGEFLEIVGAATAGLDQFATAAASNQANNVSASITTAAANEFLLMFGGTTGASVAAGASSPFTFLDALNDPGGSLGMGSAYRIVSATGTYAGTINNGASTDCGSAILSFIGGGAALPNNSTGTASTRQAETSTLAGTSAVGTVSGSSATGEGEKAVASIAIGTSGGGLSAGLYDVTGGLPDAQDAAGLTIRATYLGATLDRTLWLTKAKSGAAGSPGSAGDPGAPAVNIVLTAPALLIFAYAEGTPVDATFAQSNGLLTVFLGATDVTASCTLSATGTGCTGSINTAVNTPLSGHPMGFYQVTGMSADSGLLTLTVVYSGFTYHANVSLAKARGGYEIVATLPTTNLFEGRVVFLTTDGKLYRYHSSAWTAAVPVLDIAGAITDAQIAGLAASKITGTLTDAQLAAIAAAKITGTLSDSQLAAIAAAKITGTLSDAQLAAISSTKITGQLTSDQIASLDAAKVTGSIAVTTIADGSVTTPKIAAGAVVAASIAANTIVAGNLAANSITSASIAAGAITAGAIAAGAVTAGTLAAGAVTTANLAAGAITAATIATGAITAGAIAAGTITGDKIASRTISAASLVAASITAAELAAASVSTASLQAGAVTAAKIAAGSITADRLVANSITAGQLAANSVTATAILAGTITGDRLAAGSIITASAQINDGVIISAKIGDLQVNSAKIADLTVGTTKITGNAVTGNVHAVDNVVHGLGSSSTNFTALSVTITTTGGPVMLQMGSNISDFSNNSFLEFLRDGGAITHGGLETGFDLPAAGTHTYAWIGHPAGDPPQTYGPSYIFATEFKK